MRLGSAVEAAARDARYGARALLRSPGYAAVVIMTLALGIGPNAAIFSVLHAVLEGLLYGVTRIDPTTALL